MATQKINTDFDSAENLDQITQFEPQQKILFLPLWCDGKMLLSPVQSWETIENRWNVPLCDQNETKNCLISAQKNFSVWNKKSPKERLDFLQKWLDLLSTDLYLQHFENNFFAEPQRKNLLKNFIENIQQQINLNSHKQEIAENDGENICFLIANNSNYELGEEQFFQDFAKVFVSQIFVAGKTLIINPSPNLSPLMLALMELTSRTQPKFPDGVVNVLHGKGGVIKGIHKSFAEVKAAENENIKLQFEFIANAKQKQHYLDSINKN